MDLATKIAMAGTIAGLIFGYIGYLRGKKAERERIRSSYKEQGKKEGTLESDINYIKETTIDILREQKDTNYSINSLCERVARVEESVKSAHERIGRVSQEVRERGGEM